jgi:hypothetical protein
MQQVATLHSHLLIHCTRSLRLSRNIQKEIEGPQINTSHAIGLMALPSLLGCMWIDHDSYNQHKTRNQGFEYPNLLVLGEKGFSHCLAMRVARAFYWLHQSIPAEAQPLIQGVSTQFVDSKPRSDFPLLLTLRQKTALHSFR